MQLLYRIQAGRKHVEYKKYTKKQGHSSECMFKEREIMHKIHERIPTFKSYADRLCVRGLTGLHIISSSIRAAALVDVNSFL